MRQAFQGFLTLFGVIVIGISLPHLAIGPRAIIGSVAVDPTMAGEDRFFAGLFLCTGVASRRLRPGADRLCGVRATCNANACTSTCWLVLPPLMVVVAKRVAEPISV
ncbi:hypothetical protein Mycsm_02822 [Mycobacterium sp. JS623]|uniref:hypothetical protein n=1 Tax=Mycobacterium sp. JS623 TaxID=212767 RepID=UPI0002A55BFC|nr:hypothetical protein [Mycobacterium sp. JS623]AGB23149.1 hypothetical protein Mycsm_02822 [Mycobacterium sp. JS623]